MSDVFTSEGEPGRKVPPHMLAALHNELRVSKLTTGDLLGLRSLLLKYSEGQPRDEHGRWSTGSADPMSPEVTAGVLSWTGHYFDDDLNQPYVRDNHTVIRDALAKPPPQPPYAWSSSLGGPKEYYDRYHAQGAAILKGINGSPPTTDPLFRGIKVDDETFNHIVSLTPGDKLQMNLSSWTPDRTVAEGFAQRGPYAQGMFSTVPEGLNNPVVFNLDPGAKVLDVANRTPLPNEKEWLTAGEFQVVDLYDGAPPAGMVYVTVKQTGTFSSPAQALGSKVLKYSESEARDEHGRWTSDGGGSGTYKDWAGGTQDVPPGIDKADIQQYSDLRGKNYAALRTADPGYPPRMGEVGPTVQRWEEYHDARTADLVAEAAAQRGESAQDFQKELVGQARTLLESSDARIRVTPEVLSKVLGDGRFKSQFETRTSNGLLDMRVRREMEQGAFGYTKGATSPSDRPIYGYFGNSKNAGQEDRAWLSQYGDVVVHLNDDVKERSTFTYGDSLSPIVLPSPANDPRWESCSPNSTHMEPGWLTEDFRSGGQYYQMFHQDYPPSAYVYSRDRLAASDTNTATFDYMEAQIHGGVSTLDISRVEVQAGTSKAITDKLDAAGIPWSTYAIP